MAKTAKKEETAPAPEKEQETNTGTALANVQSGVPATYDYGDEAGKGFENQTAADYTIPFLAVLQPLSPQLNDPGNGGIEGAKAGMLYNTVSDQLWDGVPERKGEGLVFIPAYTDNVFVEWKPRDAGGGFVAQHAIDSEVVKKAREKAKRENAPFGKLKTEAGNDLVETFYVYGIEEETESGLIVAFTSTKIAVYKNWNTKVSSHIITLGNGRKINPPLFANRVRITTVKQKNNKGEYYNFVLSPAEQAKELVDPETGEVTGKVSALAASLLPPNDPKSEAAKRIMEMVKAGTAKAAYDSQNKVGEEPEAGGEEKSHF